MKNTSKHETLRGWFQLVRLPHLFTVPGDPLVGFLIAGGLMRLEQGRGVFPIAAVCFISRAFSRAAGVISPAPRSLASSRSLSCGERRLIWVTVLSSPASFSMR